MLHRAQSASPPLYDLAIVGGGIIGLSCARELTRRHPSRRIVVLEGETRLAQHQSSHNSGVIHAGIYYTPGSQRAELCRIGAQSMFDYCEKHRIPAPKVGKLIVAKDETELKGLDVLMERGRANGCQDLTYLTSSEIRLIEPNLHGVRAILSPHTGVVNFKRVADQFAKEFEAQGGEIQTGFRVTGVKGEAGSEFELEAEPPSPSPSSSASSSSSSPPQRRIVRAKKILTCAGIQSDRVASLFGGLPSPPIIPVRGSWMQLKPEYARSLVHRNIYPVPNSAFPFLGVHFTPTLADDGTSGIGSMLIGPNAVLATSRNGYALTDFSLQDTLDMVREPSMRQLIRKHWKFGLNELLEEIFPHLALRACQAYIPDLSWHMIQRYQPIPFLPFIQRPILRTGVRAQALTQHGTLEEDFVIQKQTQLGKGDESAPTSATSPLHSSSSSTPPSSSFASILHLRNCPSPAATSSISIGEKVAQMATKEFQW